MFMKFLEGRHFDKEHLVRFQDGSGSKINFSKLLWVNVHEILARVGLWIRDIFGTETDL